MMSTIFNFVAITLTYVAQAIGCTYNEINVVVYFALVPLSWVILLDLAIRKFYATPVFLGFIMIVVLLIKNFHKFADSLFNDSVRFLLRFDRIGWNYTVASVIICVVVPLTVYAVLIGWNLWTILRR